MILGEIDMNPTDFWTTLKWFWVNLSDSQTTLKWFWGESQWFANHSEISLGWILVICKPLWKDSGINLGDLQTILNISGANLDDSQIILKWFFGESQWFTNHSEIILWQISWILVDLSDLKIILKWFWGESWWILASLSDLQTILKLFCSKSWWISVILGWILVILNHSEMILGWISVWTIPKWFWVNLSDCEPLWFFSKFLGFKNHTGVIRESSRILTNHTWWEEELSFQNIQDL